MASLRTVRTMCPMNCHPTLCGMLADVEEGRLVGVRGDPDNPDSRGFLCIRGQAAREIIGNPGRLLHPMRRTARSGSWQRTTWEDALDRIAERARAVGPAALGTWSGHGFFANDYGTRVASELLRRFSNLYGCQWWNPMMICWGLGAFGLGLTGALRASTKEDMGAHAALVVLWGANLASQPNTGRYLTAAKRRGAYVVTVDVRRTEASAQSDETLLIRPGTDAALALGMMHVIVAELRHDSAFVARHTLGFDALAAHLARHDVAWAAATTGVEGERIASLARRYASTKPAMILLGGSSMHKGAQGWQGARAVACLPALTGNFGVPGGGLGPRHGAAAHGQGLSSIAARDRRPPGDYVADAKRELQKQLQLPAGYAVSWSGQYESAQRVRQRLLLIVPVTVALILFLLYCNTRSVVKTMIVILAVPFSAVGAMWMVYALGYNMSIAVWLGIIALLGIDAETGVFMLLYLDLAYEKALREAGPLTRHCLFEAIVEGAAKRLRPKFMTFTIMSIGLIPILWSTGAGSEIMKRIAAPMVGGIVTSFILELLVYPAVYAVWKERSLQRESSELGREEFTTTTGYLESAHKADGLVSVPLQQS